MPPRKKLDASTLDTPQALAAHVNSQFKREVIVTGSQLRNRTFSRASTGSLAIDLALGGGWPLNVWNEVIGNESNGKTALVLKTIAANMAINPEYQCLWIASEDFVPDWAERLGVDLDRIHLAETNVTEEAYQIMLDGLEGRSVDAVILDSLPAMVPGDEAEKQMEESTISLNARMTGKFFRKAGKVGRRSLVSEDRSYLGIIINQWRDKIGISYGDPRTTPGGKGKNFSFFTRVEVARDEWITEDGTKESAKVGIAIRARTIKNKTAPAQRTGVVDFYFDDIPGFPAGTFDRIKELVSLAVAYDIIETTSAGRFAYRDMKWHGIAAVLADVREDTLLQAALDAEIKRVVLHQDVAIPSLKPPAKAPAKKAPAKKPAAQKAPAKRPSLGRPS